ncbi:MAG TPA: tetratricopeptide repeat protein [Niabella sp.]|nr:tetratricopeptide repeat protein [Niabella sp.]HOZ96015.1 tetratricopeptide repeat protein [Niabella sp.]HQW15490.1 tetratricopeptide repeat protein [Niabella sp.]HQX20632.1 tetratricopeptide repeat protein [Niabella sp.]HQX40508.1 tetratricopeptide repeat protein [Niabella sp.]
MKVIRTLFLIFIILVSSALTFTYCQTNIVNDLKSKIANLKAQSGYLSDTSYLKSINNLAFYYADVLPDSAILLLKDHAGYCKKAGFKEGEVAVNSNLGNAYQTKGDFEKALNYYELAYQLALKNSFKKAVPGILVNIGLVLTNQGNYPDALNKYYEALAVAEEKNDKLLIGTILNNIAIVHFYQGKMHEADSAYHQTLEITLDLKDTLRTIYAYNNIGEVKLEQANADSAIFYFTKAHELAVLTNNGERLASVTNNIGNTYLSLDSLEQAIAQFEKALEISHKNNYRLYSCKALIGLAKAKNKQGKLKEAQSYGLSAMAEARQMGQAQLLRDASQILAEIFEKDGNGMDALKFFKSYKLFSDSLNNLTNIRATANENANFRISQTKVAFEKRVVRQRWILFTVLAAMVTMAVIVWLVNRNRHRLNKMNTDLLQKNELIKMQKQEAETTLAMLQSTQAQLIQSEKMASLGELTAGIAHEIQNPLNFITNFSEVSNELMEELNIKTEKLATEDKEVKELLNDISQNLEKINHHGKRADAIVKGMLQHSRSSSGQKEQTDINALCDEFLRLAFHGLKAKDKSFNVKFETDFDESIGMVKIVPQEIGRVILNLINNAFYAASLPVKHEGGLEEKHEPTIWVSTKKLGAYAQIIVKDNGPGIPDNIRDKIFQPFFTTKPTGKGTGLGLSLSYDIVTKGHHGELLIESKQNAGASFIVKLPLQ